MIVIETDSHGVPHTSTLAGEAVSATKAGESPAQHTTPSEGQPGEPTTLESSFTSSSSIAPASVSSFEAAGSTPSFGAKWLLPLAAMFAIF